MNEHFDGGHFEARARTAHARSLEALTPRVRAQLQQRRRAAFAAAAAPTIGLHRVPVELSDLPAPGFDRVIGDVRLLAAAEMLGLTEADVAALKKAAAELDRILATHSIDVEEVVGEFKAARKAAAKTSNKAGTRT